MQTQCTTQSPDSHDTVNMAPLSALRPGQTCRLGDSTLSEQDASMLKALGLRPRTRLRLCRAGQPCIVSVMNVHGACCRIGLSRPLADRVMVTISD